MNDLKKVVINLAISYLDMISQKLEREDRHKDGERPELKQIKKLSGLS